MQIEIVMKNLLSRSASSAIGDLERKFGRDLTDQEVKCVNVSLETLERLLSKSETIMKLK